MLGLVTIGQAPRDDIVASMFGEIGSSRIIQTGALDLLDASAIKMLGPTEGDEPLVTRLRDGSEVVVGHRRLMSHLQDAVACAETAGAKAICVLCTGTFPDLSSCVPLVFPDRLQLGVVDALLPAGTVGILMPHDGQRPMMERKWRTDQRRVATATASPYQPDHDLGSAVTSLVERGAELIILDCMGFDRRMLADARASTDAPVLLANALVGSVLREVIDLSTDHREELR
jgi:protein AroM